ncbi:hypothetical protein [Pseudomonas tolaasii]|uniref:hypothetical protein n=1 Tax=Pseudomonas tolaasii TaxID=29442 RepID=UPI001C52D8C5|nr:hypothetical protein [Pseudomonas tolaasii]QXQ21408.1 hypothetical protein I7845_13660 [Pseudomonas tolaasii]
MSPPLPVPPPDPLHQALNAWHEHWSLDGLYVACPNCHAQQLANDAHKSFQHLGPCALASPAPRHPWLELRDLLALLPAVSA